MLVEIFNQNFITIVYINKAYDIFDVNQNKKIEAINFSINFLQKNVAFIATYRPPSQGNLSVKNIM